MMTNKKVFFSGIGVALALVLMAGMGEKLNGVCRYVNENGHSTDYCGILAFAILPIILFIPFSAILYFFRDEVFHAWWNFARWWVPVIIVATLLLENAGGGGTLGMNKDFTAFILIILYSILAIVSLIKIVRAYLKTKEV